MYSPIDKRPTLPLGTKGDTHDYLTVAWHVYWQMVRKVMKKRQCSLLEAHQQLQKAHPFTPPNTDDGYWRTDDFLLMFMFQFEGWQLKKYDLDKIRSIGDYNDIDGITDQTPLSVVMTVVGDARRDDLVADLWCRHHTKLLKQLVDDPIYGYEARNELGNIARMDGFKASEKVRRAALPATLKKIDKLLGGLYPSNYDVQFPYPKNEYHSVPNCLCVTADGSPIFRLEVLDPDKCTSFRLAEVMPPWWKETGQLLERCKPGEGEYDFPFYDFNLVEGDEFGLAKLMEVLNRGRDQLATRGDRKWGKSV